MPTHTDTPKCYRARLQLRIGGAVAAICFPAIGVSSSCVAYWNLDGSFPHPMLHALAHGLGWSCISLLAFWFTAASCRLRLCITGDAITQRGMITERRLPVAEVSQVTWSGNPSTGKIILQGEADRLKIDLSLLSDNDRLELVQFIHQLFDAGIQIGWPSF